MTFDKYKLIMFDCDGTLIDSEYLYNKVLSHMLVESGYKGYTVDKCCELFAGTSYIYVKEYMAKNMPDIDQIKFQEQFEKNATAAAVRDLKSMDGVENILTTLKDRRKCVVTNSEKEVVDFTLSITKLDQFFEKNQIFSLESAARTKPFPDLYEAAMRFNAVLPDECITIEDTVVGATAAVAAGIKTIGFIKSHRLDKHYVSELKDKMFSAGVHEVIEDIRDYLKFL